MLRYAETDNIDDDVLDENFEIPSFGIDEIAKYVKIFDSIEDSCKLVS